MSNTIELQFVEIQNLHNIKDFLTQNTPANELIDQNNSPNENQNIVSEDIGEYVCQNNLCRSNDSEILHNYEVSSDKIITICDDCYSNGFRFCIFTHDILHVAQLEPVLDNMYAQPQFNQQQLDKDKLLKINDLHEYFQIIGIENPNPTYFAYNQYHDIYLSDI